MKQLGKRTARGAATSSTAKKRSAPPAHVDPLVSAKTADCIYVDVDTTGITRARKGKGFTFRDVNGRVVRDEAVLRRIRSLVIPPAWSDVWICPLAEGHIQATGRDARGRKQYRYHARFRAVRDETKYARMLSFAHALPTIRAKVDAAMSTPGLSREKVLATVVRLLEITLIRIGNEEYAQKNGSFGLTTMRGRHLDLHGSDIRFHFRGKSGKVHDVDVHDRRLAKILHRCNDLPGETLFQFLDDDGSPRSIESSDVNAYLREIAGDDFTAKDFRTWAGTVLAARALAGLEAFASVTAAKRNIVEAVRTVAARLGNTPAVCRKCYVHPEIFDAYLDGALVEALERRAEVESANVLSADEAAVLELLRARIVDAEGRTLTGDMRATLRAIGTKRRPRAAAPA